MKIGILASGNGTSIVELLSLIKDKKINADVSVIISNNPDCGIKDKANKYNIPIYIKSSKDCSRLEFDNIINDELKKYDVDVLLTVGYMRILSDFFIDTWEGKIYNVHPSLLPKHAGLMDLDVHENVLSAGDNVTGCTIHHVIKKVDSGDNVIQKKCSVEKDDTAISLKEKVQALESKAWIELINLLLSR